MAYVVMAYIVMACITMAYIVMAYIVMAYIVMAYAVMACIAMAYIVMAARLPVIRYHAFSGLPQRGAKLPSGKVPKKKSAACTCINAYMPTAAIR